MVSYFNYGARVITEKCFSSVNSLENAEKGQKRPKKAKKEQKI